MLPKSSLRVNVPRSRDSSGYMVVKEKKMLVACIDELVLDQVSATNEIRLVPVLFRVVQYILKGVGEDML